MVDIIIFIIQVLKLKKQSQRDHAVNSGSKTQTQAADSRGQTIKSTVFTLI